MQFLKMRDNARQYRTRADATFTLRMPSQLRGDLDRVAAADGRSAAAFAVRAIATGIAAFDRSTAPMVTTAAPAAAISATPPPSWEFCG